MSKPAPKEEVVKFASEILRAAHEEGDDALPSVNPMLALDLSGKWDGDARSQLLTIVERAKTARTTGNQAANQELLVATGLMLLPENNDAYYCEALDYHLGVLHAFLGQPEEAARHLELSNTMPGAGGNLAFSEHQYQSLRLSQIQNAAIRRGMPAILIASMPRSASATLTQTLGRALDLAVLRVSTGGFPDYFIAPSWLNQFLRGGATSHDHFSACAFNLEALRRGGVKHLFVLIRDPRASAASAANKAGRADEPGAESMSALVTRKAITAFIPWAEGWLSAASAIQEQPRIHLLRSDFVRQDAGAATRKILTLLTEDFPELQHYCERHIDEMRANFVRGDDDAWQQMVSNDDRAKMWEAMSAQMSAWLDLKP